MNKAVFCAGLAGLALAGCATPTATGAGTTVPNIPANSVVVALPPASQSRGVLVRAGASGAPSLAEVERTLGPADVARRETEGALLTYRLDTCALVLGFSADNDRNEMRLALAQPGARSPGTAAPTLADCANELDARRAARPTS